jgi:hypothetical protein
MSACTSLQKRTWGLNYENDRAWVVAEASVDLQALVKDALTDK